MRRTAATYQVRLTNTKKVSGLKDAERMLHNIPSAQNIATTTPTKRMWHL